MSNHRKEILFEVRLPRGYQILDDISGSKFYLDENSRVRIIDCSDPNPRTHHSDIMTIRDARQKYG
jgi:hypothetical protein